MHSKTFSFLWGEDVILTKYKCSSLGYSVQWLWMMTTCWWFLVISWHIVINEMSRLWQEIELKSMSQVWNFSMVCGSSHAAPSPFQSYHWCVLWRILMTLINQFVWSIGQMWPCTVNPKELNLPLRLRLIFLCDSLDLSHTLDWSTSLVWPTVLHKTTPMQRRQVYYIITPTWPHESSGHKIHHCFIIPVRPALISESVFRAN